MNFKVLIVDDVEANRDLLARRLKRNSYLVEMVESGTEAIARVDRGGIDLVLMDIHMPDMDGIEALQTLRERYDRVALPVFMVTAEAASSEVVRALRNGANDYVTKPINFPVLLARVEAQEVMKTAAAEKEPKAASSAASDDLEPGFLLDSRYEIQSCLGEGGFAVVYKGIQQSTGQEVAIKLLRLDRVEHDKNRQSEIARFMREMDVIASIQHPNIVRLIDSGALRVERSAKRRVSAASDLDATIKVGAGNPYAKPRAAPEPLELPYLVMEYLQGRTLGDLLAEKGRLELEDAVEIALPVISALSTAHSQGVVHRDITVENIFLEDGEQGIRPRVLDFGIAKLTDQHQAKLTTTNVAMGTPLYMSPEQARGVSDLTSASDQYSLGSVLYECVTGKKPHDGLSSLEVLHKVAKADYLPPRQIRPDLPRRFDSALRKAMSLNPEDRFQSIQHFGRVLLRFAHRGTSAQWTPVMIRG